MISDNRPVDDDMIRLEVEFDRPLSGITQTDTEWLLGQMHVDKREACGGTSWRSSFGATTRFYKRATLLADGTRVVGVILRMCDADDPPGQTQIEYLTGWVPSEREHEADGWIAFLNQEIAERLAGVPTTRALPRELA